MDERLTKSSDAASADWPVSSPRHVPGCFCCALGLKWKIHLDSAQFELFMDRRFHGGAAEKQVHGGLISALLDEVMGNCGRVLNRDHATVTFDIRFLAPVACGETVLVRGHITSFDERGFTAAGDLSYGAGDRTRAEAIGRWVWVDSERMKARSMRRPASGG